MSDTKLEPWGDDVALMGPDAPKWNGQIEHLIRYLLTVHKRFGNTAITSDLQWGASALHKRDTYKELIIQLESKVDALERELAAAQTEFTSPSLEEIIATLNQGNVAKAARLIQKQASELSAAESKVDALEDWKQSQLSVEATWNPQDVAKALDLQLGSDIRKNILPAIKQLQTKVDALMRELQDAREAADGYSKGVYSKTMIDAAKAIAHRISMVLAQTWNIISLTRTSSRTDGRKLTAEQRSWIHGYAMGYAAAVEQITLKPDGTHEQ